MADRLRLLYGVVLGWGDNKPLSVKLGIHIMTGVSRRASSTYLKISWITKRWKRCSNDSTSSRVKGSSKPFEHYSESSAKEVSALYYR